MAGSKRNSTLLALIILASTACSAWYLSADLDAGNWDEGHSMRNIRSIVATGSWRPSFAFYPGLSHLPQAALMTASQRVFETNGNRAFEILRPNGNFTTTAYLFARSTSLVYSVAILLLLYRTGRRVFSEEIGLLAVAILALSPFFLKIAGTYKPDALLVLTALAAYGLAVRAAQSGSAAHYLLAGMTIGLSASAKQNGAFSSIPLVVATALHAREAKRWGWLIAAGALSVVVFLIFNPWPELLPQYLSMSQRYENWAQTGAVGAPHTLLFVARLPFIWSWHGIALGTAAWVGLVGLGVRAIKRRHARPQQAGAALLVLSVAAYPLACLLVSSHPKPNIFIPTLPLTALAAAWALVRAWELLFKHSSKPLAKAVAAISILLLLGICVPPYAKYLYSVAVPTTAKAASDWITHDAGYLAQRLVVTEARGLSLEIRRRHKHREVPLEIAPERLSDVPSPDLDLADYEVFLSSSLQSGGGDFYRDRMARLESRGIQTFDAELFTRRGRGLVVLSHPWRVSRKPKHHMGDLTARVEWTSSGTRRLSGRLPKRLRPGHVVSLDLILTPEQAEECALEVNGAELEVQPYLAEGGRARHMTRRFVTRRRATPIRFLCPRRDLLDPLPAVDAIRWVPSRIVATAS